MESQDMKSSEPARKADRLYEKGELYQISLNDLLSDPNQPRKVMDAQNLDELAQSIGKHGILEPVLFCRHEDGNLIVVAGERRIAAARRAGMSFVPAMYVEGNYAEIALVENLLRQDLTAVEEAEALQRLMEQQKYTHEQLSNVIGKARTTISDILLINRLPQEIRDDCRGNRSISKKILIDIARKKQERAMITAYNSYKERMLKPGHSPLNKKNKKTDNGSSEFTSIFSMADKLQNKLKNCDVAGCNQEGIGYLHNKLLELKDRIDSFLPDLALFNSYKAKGLSDKTDQ